MKLTKSEDNINVYERLVSEDGKIEMGVYPVMFGFRVRAGFVGDGYCHIDWCCGAEQSFIEFSYTLLKNILETKDTENPFEELRGHSQIKPIFKDDDFMKWLFEFIEEYKDAVDNTIKIKPVQEIKEQAFKDLANL